jgi:serine phosphatase RsbU (regulator of sigma subunit)/anti-sigma regulatory factor (Ser/Thr protein kinase)
VDHEWTGGGRSRPDDFGLTERLAAQLVEAFEDGPAMLLVTTGPQHVLVHQNAMVNTVFGPREAGLPMRVAYPDLDDELHAFLDATYAAGRPAEVLNQRVRVRPGSPLRVWVDYTCTPLRNCDGDVSGLAIVAVNATGRVEAERARRRLELISRVTAAVGAELDPDMAIHRLTETLVPDVADLAAVYLADQNEVARVAPAWAAGSVATVPASIARRVALAVAPYVSVPTATAQTVPRLEVRHAADPIVRALLTGQPVSVNLDATLLGEVVNDPAGLAWLRAAGAHSCLAVPLSIAGRVAGVVALMVTGEREPYTSDDTVLLTDVAARAAVAITNAFAYQRERQAALTLQRSLLPSTEPQVDGLELAARYVAAGTHASVGGDWWDVHDLGAGRVGFGIGDVAGRGTQAAAVMGQLRAAMRTAAYADLPPADALTLLDEQLADLPDNDPAVEPIRFATAAYATYDPRHARVDLASAGHLPALIVTADGRTQWLGEPDGQNVGVPLGLRGGGVAEHAVELPPGATIALFSDGLVEDRHLDLDEGLAMLAEALARHLTTGEGLGEAADAVLAELGRGEGHDDDVALLLVRPTAAGRPVASATMDVRGGAHVADARRMALRVLADAGVGGYADLVELVVSELVGNSLRHAMPPVRVHVHVSAVRIVVEVTDSSGRLPRRRVAESTDETGRGLELVAAVADRWGSRMVPAGKATWAKFRRPAAHAPGVS